MAKVSRYAVAESGDSVEIVERPRGGVSVVIVDGQRYGEAAKRVSHQVANRVVSLIGDGARDGAVIRAVHDVLYAQRAGRVSATLSLLSVDLEAGLLLISRNSNSPVLVWDGESLRVIQDPVEPIGVHRMMKPHICQYPLRPGLLAAAFTDGVWHAGRRAGGAALDVERVGAMLREVDLDDLSHGADRILDYAIELDQGRPRDDMALVLLGIAGEAHALGSGVNPVRRMSLSYPIRRVAG